MKQSVDVAIIRLKAISKKNEINFHQMSFLTLGSAQQSIDLTGVIWMI